MATPHKNGINEANTLQTDYTIVDSEPWPPIGSIIGRNIRRMHTKRYQFLKDRLPILKWMPKYQLSYLFYDFIAGLTVGLTAIPLGIAYAIVAGLPPHYGLYSSFMSAFVYIIFGSCMDVTIGPTAILSLLIQHYVAKSFEFAFFLAFMNGVIIFGAGLLNLGFLVQFISVPVSIGFTTAAAATIASVQVKLFVGLTGPTSTFLDAWNGVFNQIKETRPGDAALGAFSLALLLFLKNLKYEKSLRDVENESLWKNECKKYLSLSRNAIVVILGSILAYILNNYGYEPFTLTGEVASGFPELKMPPLQTTIGNETLYFNDMIKSVGSSIVALPLVSILECVTVAKAFSKGRSIDATQEMIAVGLCNLFGSFFQAMPVTSVLARTAVNNASGARTTFGGIVTGCIVLISIGFLTSSFCFIPKTALSAVIICAMMFTVDRDEIKVIWRSNRIEMIPFVFTILACLLYSIQYGILFGVAINILFVLYSISRPVIHVNDRKDILVLLPDQGLTFSSSEHFKRKVSKYVTQSRANIVIIDGRHIHTIDATVAKSICTVVEDLHLLNKKVFFLHWNKVPMGVLCRLDPDMFILFKDDQTEDELWKLMNMKNSTNGKTIEIPTDAKT